MMIVIFLIGMMTVLIGTTSFQEIMCQKPIPLDIEYPHYFGGRIVTTSDNPTTVEGVRLGRMLFYEAALSANGKISCASCHQQSHAFTDERRFSTGVEGSLLTRNTMSIANLLWVRQLFWDGRAHGLEEQVKEPLTNPHEMGQSLEISSHKLTEMGLYLPYFKAAFGIEQITGNYIVKALAQFQRTLVSASSPYDHYLQGNYEPSSAQLRGMQLFFGNTEQGRGINCAHCHGGPQTYQELFHNKGLEKHPSDIGRAMVTRKPYDQGRFRVATLRNIALTAPYMHDGRFQTLEDVIEHYNSGIVNSPTLSPFLKDKEGNPIKLGLTESDKKDLLDFSHMLTDSAFVLDERFSNPFK